MKKWFDRHIDLLSNLLRVTILMSIAWTMHWVWTNNPFSLRDIIIAFVGFIGAVLWTEVDKLPARRKTIHDYFWQLHVKLAQIGYSIVNNKYPDYDFKIAFGEFIHLCGACPISDPKFVELLTSFQNAEMCLYPIVQDRQFVENGVLLYKLGLNYPSNEEATWRNFKFAYEKFSGYVAGKIYVDGHEFELFSSVNEYITTHKLIHPTIAYTNALHTELNKKALTKESL